MAGPIRKSPDIRRLGSAVSYPGIDPRVWFSYAIVKELGYDADEGVFADVMLVPDGEPETVLLGHPYAGGDFGFWFPVNEGDTVLVAMPRGDQAGGPVIVSRVWNAGDPPPSDIQDSGNSEEPTKDVVLKVQSSQRLVLRTSAGDTVLDVSEGGNVSISVAGGGDVSIDVSGGGGVKTKVTGGDVATEVSGGNASIEVTGGDAVVAASGGFVKLGDDTVIPPLQGVVNGQGIDPFTGMTYFALGNASNFVAAKK